MVDAKCSVAQLDAEPPKQHAQYDLVNGVVRGRFAAGSLAVAFNNGWGDASMQALSHGKMQSLTTYYLLLTAYCLLLTTGYLLLTAHCLLLTTYYLLLTTGY